jgi:hypothetical protein
MKKSALIIALALSTAATGAALAASAPDALASPNAQSRSEPALAQEPGARRQTRLAEGLFENRGEGRGERHGHHARHWDNDDDDDDDDRGHSRKGAENRPADPNAANAPLPDNGVFNGKSRPKVEVQ